MVTNVKSLTHHSPPSAPPPAQPVDGSSPKFPRKNLSSLWADVVRGGQPESVVDIHQSSPSPSSSSSSLAADQVSSSECSPKVVLSLPVHNCNTADCSESCEGNVDRPKKPVWKKPSNGVECGPVMGAESWPALSVSTKGSAKLSAESSSIVDGSLSTSQRGPMTSQSSSRKQVTTNARHNSVPNYNVLNRSRTMRRLSGNNSGSVGPSQSNFSNPPLPPPPPPFPVYQLPPVNYGNCNMVPGTPDPVTRDHYRDNNWDARPIVGGFMPIMNEYRGSSPWGYFGLPHPRGDGSYHNSRFDDSGNYVNTRDVFLPQPRMLPRGLLRHPPPRTAAFVGTPIGSYANSMGFSEFYYYQPVAMEQFSRVPYITHGPPPATYLSAEPLSNLILKQIEYYFCDDNLAKDEFLKSKMDDQGWVPVTLIADFPRIRNLTNNIQLILDSLRTSSVVEVQGDKLRHKNEWQTWVLAGSVSPLASRHSNLTSNFQNIALEETTKDESSTESNT